MNTATHFPYKSDLKASLNPQSVAAMAVEEQRPVHGGEVEEHDHQDEEVVEEPKQPQHACTSSNTHQSAD